MNKENLIVVMTKDYVIDVKSFSIDPPEEGEINSGYIIDYSSKDKRFITMECLDGEHIEKELTSQGMDEKLINFILSYL